MNKKIQISYIAVFMVMCSLPLLCLPLFPEESNAEKRELSQFPSISADGGGFNKDWSSQFETYFSEHFAFRSKLVTLGSVMRSEIFRTSPVEKVTVGKNDWLYFSETLPDYTGENAMSGRRVYCTAKTVALMQEHFETDGRKFLFFCAPNKNSVYPENMPSRYIKSASPSNRERINETLGEMGVSNIDITELFESRDEVLYLSRDSHWTNEGALLAYNAAADKLGIEHDDFSSCSFTRENVWHADLDEMLYPSFERLSEQTVYDIDFTFDYAGGFTGEDDLLIKTANADAAGGNLLMYRDSFGRAFYPYAAQNANRAYFSRETPYNTSYADDINADCVILEIVERNLPNLTASAPLMNAPSRTLDVSASIDTSDENICDISAQGKKIKLCGRLDEKYFKDDSDIYITLETDGAVYAYEAFPIYESDVLGDTTQSDFGFSLTIDKTAVPAGDYEIDAYIKNGADFICTGALGNISLGD